MSQRNGGRLSDKPVFGYQVTMEHFKFYLTHKQAEAVNGNSIVYYLILHSPDFITVFAGLLQYCPPVMPSHASHILYSEPSCVVANTPYSTKKKKKRKPGV